MSTITKAELIEENENLKKQNGELLYLLEFGKLKCEIRGGQMLWERDSISWILKNRINMVLEKIEYYKTTEWGLKSIEILEIFEKMLRGE